MSQRLKSAPPGAFQSSLARASEPRTCQRPPERSSAGTRQASVVRSRGGGTCQPILARASGVVRSRRTWYVPGAKCMVGAPADSGHANKMLRSNRAGLIQLVPGTYQPAWHEPGRAWRAPAVARARSGWHKPGAWHVPHRPGTRRVPARASGGWRAPAVGQASRRWHTPGGALFRRQRPERQAAPGGHTRVKDPTTRGDTTL